MLIIISQILIGINITPKIPKPSPKKIPPFDFFKEQNIYHKPPLYIILCKTQIVTNKILNTIVIFFYL